MLVAELHRPLVSIIIPCHNAERWVGAAIESALGQTYPNTEVIVVDDGSTDRSLSAIKQFDSKITWRSTSNRGPCAARNTGLAAARGAWIQFLDADDLLHPGKVHHSLKACDIHPTVEFVWAPHMNINEQFLSSACRNEGPEAGDLRVAVSDQALAAPYAPALAMFRRSFLDRVGPWNESLRRWVDLEYHSRIAALMPSYAIVDKPLYFYRQHSGDRISNSNANHSNIERALVSLTRARANLEASNLLPEAYKSYLWPFYLQLALSSAKNRDKKMFLQLMETAADVRRSLKFQVKCSIGAGCARLFGLKVTMAIVDTMLPVAGSKARRPLLSAVSRRSGRTC